MKKIFFYIKLFFEKYNIKIAYDILIPIIVGTLTSIGITISLLNYYNFSGYETTNETEYCDQSIVGTDTSINKTTSELMSYAEKNKTESNDQKIEYTQENFIYEEELELIYTAKDENGFNQYLILSDNYDDLLNEVYLSFSMRINQYGICELEDDSFSNYVTLPQLTNFKFSEYIYNPTEEYVLWDSVPLTDEYELFGEGVEITIKDTVYLEYYELSEYPSYNIASNNEHAYTEITITLSDVEQVESFYNSVAYQFIGQTTGEDEIIYGVLNNDGEEKYLVVKLVNIARKITSENTSIEYAREVYMEYNELLTEDEYNKHMEEMLSGYYTYTKIFDSLTEGISGVDLYDFPSGFSDIMEYIDYSVMCCMASLFDYETVAEYIAEYKGYVSLDYALYNSYDGIAYMYWLIKNQAFIEQYATEEDIEIAINSVDEDATSYEVSVALIDTIKDRIIEDAYGVSIDHNTNKVEIDYEKLSQFLS